MASCLLYFSVCDPVMGDQGHLVSTYTYSTIDQILFTVVSMYF